MTTLQEPEDVLLVPLAFDVLERYLLIVCHVAKVAISNIWVNAKTRHGMLPRARRAAAAARPSSVFKFCL